uniref:Uncharacterized protein n=1 Tax=Rhizophora mucronata TaxID=61149 RepID=A0A2P2QEJ7_RHIMU
MLFLFLFLFSFLLLSNQRTSSWGNPDNWCTWSRILDTKSRICDFLKAFWVIFK